MRVVTICGVDRQKRIGRVFSPIDRLDDIALEDRAVVALVAGVDLDVLVFLLDDRLSARRKRIGYLELEDARRQHRSLLDLEPTPQRRDINRAVQRDRAKS
jgi:hypothetical protein